MIALAAIVIALPFVAAFAGMLLGPSLTLVLRGRRPRPGTMPSGRWAPLTGNLRNGPALIAVLPMALATVLSLFVLLIQWLDDDVRTGTLTLVETGTFPIAISLFVDGLSAVVAFMVCCVALAVQVYSVTYMRKDPRYSSYAAFISLFTSAMLLVVLSGDLLLLYVGWEVMGVCSYFLIGHHWEDRANSRAAVKAFLVTRLGDVGFLFGIFVLGVGAKSFSIRHLIENAQQLPDTTVLVGTLLLLAGVAGKSAQFPLHTWLPDAMAGPTPISALIHAATMVAAGIYVVARLYPAFLQAPESLAVLGVMAAISMLGAALAALAQNDLKRVLAYSTVSQLAFMAGGLAVGTRDGAIFHLLTHGAYKALLFLAAGCVITVVGTNMLGAMGGLRLAMPVTFWSMTIAFAALVGVPPASGFFSKESIIGAAEHSATHDGTLGHAASGGWFSYEPVERDGTLALREVLPGNVPGAPGIPGGIAWLIFLTMLVTVAVTAAYATRAWLMTFFGEQRSSFTPREAPPLMRWPVAVLAIPALILGFFGLGMEDLRPELGSSVLSVLCAAAGGGLAFWMWNADPALDPARRLGVLRPVFDRAFYVDELYDVAVVRPVRALARAVVGVDRKVIDAAVEGSGRASRSLGGLLRIPHNGNPQTYVSGVLAGVVIIAIAVVAMEVIS